MRKPDMVLTVPPGTGVESCAVFFSDRARRLSIRIRPDGSLQMTVPFGVSGKAVNAFLLEMIPWIRRTLPGVRRRSAAAKRADLRFPDTVTLAFPGETFRTEYRWLDKCWTAARLDRESHTLLFSGCVLDGGSVLAAFSELLKRTAQSLFPDALADLSERTGIAFCRCTVRMQSSRWGSCSADGNISLNAKLLLFPPEIVEYVMIHELCHRREMNHSDAFWREVTAFLPDWKIRRSGLKREFEKLPEALRRLA